MTEVIAADGSKQETSLPADAVADLQAPKPEEKPAEPTKVEEPVKPAAEAPKAEEPEAAKPTEPEAPARGKKATPIQNLLNQRHELETQLEAANKAKADLEAKLAGKPAAADTPAKVKALAEKYQLPEEFVQEMVDAARDGLKAPELPKEVQDLVAKQQEAAIIEAEQQGFDTDYSRLENTLNDEQLKSPEVKDKLMELAYSTEKAPDGEPYFKKPLYELYMNYVKPEVEPGTPSAEPSRGGTKAAGKVTDFAAIKADPAALEEFSSNASPEEFEKFQKWDRETSGDTPMRKPQTV